ADAPAVAEAPPPDLPPGGLFVGEERVAVLMYHDVTDQPSVYFDITPAAFRFHLETLRRAGANVVSLADLYDHLRSGKLLPPRSVVLTFDDTYSGQLTHAYPLLKQYGYPATFFVHTGVIGRRTSRDHMTWEQLQALDEEGLVRVEAHTESHPDDLRKLTDEELQRELVDSKKLLEERLGKQIRFLAYPVGNADGRVAQVTREAGYEMAFTMGPGMASSPADAYFVPRLLPTRIPEVLEGWREERVVPVARSEVVELKVAPLDQGELKDGQVKLQYIRGGKLSSLRLLGRRDVPRMVRMAGAAAGLNGTFFSDARVNSAGNGIVGPVLSRFGPGFAPGLPGDREKIAGRPLVMIGPNQMAFLPFQPHLMLDETGVERLLPGTTDAFVAGAWLVHRGNPVTKEAMETFGLTNIFDFRPRAFLGVDRAGRPFLGASSTGNQSDRLAETLMKLDLQECVLLDSGFSTSLVSGKEVLVTGIRRKNMEARPVPHVLVLHPVDEATGKEQLVVDPLPAGAWGPPYVPTLERLQAALQQDLPSLVQDETWNRRSGRRGRRGRGRRR
ncbi:MAG: polysaccharide deacetylase, partial [Armatimonadetes bacterium]|nr:polysaccharide deacetylase [Armatimonadota bacterium]